MSLHTAALLKQFEVNISKCLLSELRLKIFKSKKKMGVVVIDEAIIKGTLQLNNHI